jgi:hypothetical protein
LDTTVAAADNEDRSKNHSRLLWLIGMYLKSINGSGIGERRLVMKRRNFK